MIDTLDYIAQMALELSKMALEAREEEISDMLRLVHEKTLKVLREHNKNS